VEMFWRKLFFIFGKNGLLINGWKSLNSLKLTKNSISQD
jgi:hypothetical protein